MCVLPFTWYKGCGLAGLEQGAATGGFVNLGEGSNMTACQAAIVDMLDSHKADGNGVSIQQVTLTALRTPTP